MINKEQIKILESFKPGAWFILADIQGLTSIPRETIITELTELIKSDFIKSETIQLRSRKITKYSRTKKQLTLILHRKQNH